MVTQEFADRLEQLVDDADVQIVLESLANICWEKSAHIKSNWQDRPLASRWAKYGNIIDSARARVAKL